MKLLFVCRVVCVCVCKYRRIKQRHECGFKTGHVNTYLDLLKNINDDSFGGRYMHVDQVGKS